MYQKAHNIHSNILTMENSSIISDMGKYIKYHRLTQNKTQKELALDSGIERETIARIENGATFNIGTFIQLLRHLNALEDFINIFKVENIITPSMYLKMQKKIPQRIRHSKV